MRKIYLIICKNELMIRTTGVVSSARGCPLYKLKAGRLDLMGKRVAVKEEYRQNCIENVQKIVNRMNKDF